jgi:ribosomal protein S27E
LSEDGTDEQIVLAFAYVLKRRSEVIDPRIAYDPDVIKTMLPHSAFGHRECRGCLNGIIAGHGADIVCDECGTVVRTVPEPQIEWALAQMQFAFDARFSVHKANSTAATKPVP